MNFRISDPINEDLVVEITLERKSCDALCGSCDALCGSCDVLCASCDALCGSCDVLCASCDVICRLSINTIV